jgi:ubiquitin thioesterase protein OTUB1
MTEAEAEPVSQPQATSQPASQTARADLPPDLADLTDEQICTLTQEITDSYSKDVPLVGPFLPISVLVDEFKDNEPFKKKLNGLAEKWSGFRRTARNGNCFYQTFAYAWLDSLQRLGDKRIKEEIEKIENTAKTLEGSGILDLSAFDIRIRKTGV